MTGPSDPFLARLPSFLGLAAVLILVDQLFGFVASVFATRGAGAEWYRGLESLAGTMGPMAVATVALVVSVTLARRPLPRGPAYSLLVLAATALVAAGLVVVIAIQSKPTGGALGGVFRNLLLLLGGGAVILAATIVGVREYGARRVLATAPLTSRLGRRRRGS